MASSFSLLEQLSSVSTCTPHPNRMKEVKHYTDLESERLEMQNEALLKVIMTMIDLHAQVKKKDQPLDELSKPRDMESALLTDTDAHHINEFAMLKDQLSKLNQHLGQSHQPACVNTTEPVDDKFSSNAENSPCIPYLNELQQQKEVNREAQGKYDKLLTELEATQLELATLKVEHERNLAKKVRQPDISNDVLHAPILMKEDDRTSPHSANMSTMTVDRATSTPAVGKAFSPESSNGPRRGFPTSSASSPKWHMYERPRQNG